MKKLFRRRTASNELVRVAEKVYYLRSGVVPAAATSINDVSRIPSPERSNIIYSISKRVLRLLCEEDIAIVLGDDERFFRNQGRVGVSVKEFVKRMEAQEVLYMLALEDDRFEAMEGGMIRGKRLT